MKSSKVAAKNSFVGSSSDTVFKFYQDRVRQIQELHQMKTKIAQYRKKNLPSCELKNFSLQETAAFYLNAYLKNQKNKLIALQQFLEEQRLTQEQIISLQSKVLSYNHTNDQEKKWLIIFNLNLLQNDCIIDSIHFLSILLMFEDGYFPFFNKKISKAKIFIQYLENLKKRPSKMIETFKCRIGQNWLIMHWTIYKESRNQKQIQQKSINPMKKQRLNINNYMMCIYLQSITTEICQKSIDKMIDKLFESPNFNILPGQIKFSPKKILEPQQIFVFKNNKFKFESTKAEGQVRRVFPSKVQQNQPKTQLQVNEISNFSNFQVEKKKDTTNYQSARYIFAQLSKRNNFIYSLSPSQFDVLQSKGNLIVIGRSGTGKTTCALMRLLFKQLNNKNKLQKNVFLTASPVLISEIAKKYNELSTNIIDMHQFDYFKKYQAITNETLILRFLQRLDQVNQQFKRKKYNNFLQYKQFPCFLTIRQYIQSIDAALDIPFFTNQNHNIRNEITQQEIIYYPDKIQWQQRVIKTRKINLNSQNTQENWYEINYQYFIKKIWQLSQFKKFHSFSPEIIWSQIFSTIKGSSRAHSFYHKYLDLDNYCRQSKNQFLSIEDKRKVYQIFLEYEKYRQSSNQYDLNDVVNNILIELNKNKYKDLSVSSLFIDEIQDFPPSFIFLVGKIVQESLFFSGDTAQTIAKGVRFSFSAIRQQFSQKYFENTLKLSKPILKPLHENFRSQNEIIQLSNCLIRILELMFPNSIDKMPFQISKNKGMKPIMIKSENISLIAKIFQQKNQMFETHKKNMFGADKAIIVRNKQDKKCIPQFLQNMTCLTYQQCKGLQYQVVILFNFFSSKKAQWSFLKHIEFQDRLGKKQLCFNKNKFGSNINLYFDLCSELKILYTVVTRPKSILILCDNNFPQQILKIFNFLELIKYINSSQQYYFYQKEVNQLKQTKNNQKFSIGKVQEQQKLNYSNQSKNQNKVSQSLQLNDINDQRFSKQKFVRQWAEEGIKMFFQRKNYLEAEKCFRNIENYYLADISRTYQLATCAAGQNKTTKQRNYLYHQAAKIFLQRKLIYEAGKCFYLSENYREALVNFQKLEIKKYQAQCQWKLHNYIKAKQIFFDLKKYDKGFKVLIDSKYWFLFLKNLHSHQSDITLKDQKEISQGLYECHKCLLNAYCQYFLKDQKGFSVDSLDITLLQFFSKIYGDNNRKIQTYLNYKHQLILQIEQKCQIRQPQRIKARRQAGYTLFQILKIQKQIQVLDQLLRIIIYNNNILVKYKVVTIFQKYNDQNFGQEQGNNNFNSDIRLYLKCLKILFSTLQTFKLYNFILYITKCLKFDKIQELIVIQNIFSIKQSITNALIINKKIINHKKSLQLVENPQILQKISIIIMIFGKNKQIPHFQEKSNKVMDIYFNTIQDQDIQQKKVNLKINLIIKNYNISFYKSNIYNQYGSLIRLKALSYELLFDFIDNLSQNSYYKQNKIKDKQFVDFHKKLVIEEPLQLQKQLKLQDQKIKQQKQTKWQQLITLLAKKQEERQTFNIKASQQQISNVAKKQKIIFFIKELLILPIQWEKNGQKSFKLKVSVGDLKRQRNQKLNSLDQQAMKSIRQQQKKIKTLDLIDERQKQKLNEQIKMKNFGNQMAIFNKRVKQKQYQKYQLIEQQKRFKEKIQSLESRKKGNRNDKKVDQLIDQELKKMQPLKNQIKKVVDDQKLLLKSVQQCKKNLQQMISRINKINEQIMNYKYYIKYLKLGQINKNGQLVLNYDKQQIARQIERQIKPQIQTIEDQNRFKKLKLQKYYGEKIRYLEQYVYYNETVPNGNINKRKKILQQIEKIKCSKQNYEIKITDQMDKRKKLVEIKFKQSIYSKHIYENRKNIIQQYILKNQDIKTKLSSEFCQILNFIAKISKENNRKISEKQKIKEDTKFLTNILQQDQNSYENIFFFMFCILHTDSLPIIKSIVDQECFKIFGKQLQIFLQKIFLFNENFDLAHQNKFLMKVLSIYGIQVIESFNDDLIILQGFSLIKKQHNIVSQLKRLFSYPISQNFILLRNIDAVKIFKNQLIKILNSSRKLFEVTIPQFETNYDLILKNSLQLDQLDFRDEKELSIYQQYLFQQMNQINQQINARKLQYYDISFFDRIQLCLHSFKALLFNQIILTQESLKLNLENKSQRISFILNKLPIISQFLKGLKVFKIITNQSFIHIGSQILIKKQSKQDLIEIKNSTNCAINEIQQHLKRELGKKNIKVHKRNFNQEENVHDKQQQQIKLSKQRENRLFQNIQQQQNRKIIKNGRSKGRISVINNLSINKNRNESQSKSILAANRTEKKSINKKNKNKQQQSQSFIEKAMNKMKAFFKN